MIAYLDSSAIIKQYLVEESGADDLASIMETASGIVTSRLSFVEVRAGLAAARRAERLSPMEHDRAVAKFESTWRTIDVVELDPLIGARAGMVAETFGLRAGDAIQLASILEMDLDETLLVAWDGRLTLAARAAGVLTYPSEL